MELVERMRGDADCERERREGVEQARVTWRCGAIAAPIAT